MINYDGTCRQLIRKFNNIIPMDLLFHNALLYWINQHGTDNRVYITNITSRLTSTLTPQLRLKPTSVVFFGNTRKGLGQWSEWIDITSCPANCVGIVQRKRVCQNPFLSNYEKRCVKTKCTRNFQCYTNGNLQSTETSSFQCVYPCKAINFVDEKKIVG
ncbi:uncharacterized protein LOC130646341 [Hydractinia symbiolongicarpus]|uniref:uncharacterized protein LOC130646341 n=1 Tax=Hydractinia symbiolongicarpus TaxID=13093 RepID=UPI00254F7001|nr:uncharacterized protein LOC130646341 [Hydractinia symbiolongicarpus]